MSIANSVLHVVNMILIIVLMVLIGEGCDVTGDNRCGGFGGAIVGILGVLLAWYVGSLIICVAAANYAFKMTPPTAQATAVMPVAQATPVMPVAQATP